MIPSNIIINADDFGMNANRNIAITKCFQKKIINSSSIMPNMPAFKEAVLLAEAYNFKDKLGFHASITEGKALTDLSKTPLVDKNGFFISKKVYKPTVFFSRFVRNKIKNEIEAQLDVLYQFKIKPTHINTHYDIHDLPWLLPIFFNVAKAHNIKLRICITWNNGINPLKPVYRKVVNQILKYHNLDFSNYFVTLEVYNKTKKLIHNKITEIVVHPDLNEDGTIIDSMEHIDLEKYLLKLTKD
jgi:hypothetical protein